MAIVTVGIDLAKNVYAVHGVNAAGKSALVRPDVSRTKLLELIAKLPPCLIGIEACSGAHTMICKHVLKVAAGGTASPLDLLSGMAA